MNEKYQRYLALVELLNKPLNLDQLREECMWSDVNIEDTILTYTQRTRKDCEAMTEKVCLKCHRHFKKLDNSIVVNCEMVFCKKCAEHMKKLMFNDLKQDICWEELPVDTPILVREFEHDEWLPRHFCHYKNGFVYAFNGGGTSFTRSIDQVQQWEYAKLAEDKHEEP